MLQAGKTLAQRFNEAGQYLRSFVAEDSIFIDIMMNVGIIFYAARERNDKHAARHCGAPLHDHAAISGSRRWIHGA